MLNVICSGQFKTDYKKCVKRGLDMNLLKSVIAALSIDLYLDRTGTHAAVLLECTPEDLYKK